MLTAVVLASLVVFPLAYYLVDAEIGDFVHRPVESFLYSRAETRGSSLAASLHTLWVCRMCIGQWIAFAVFPVVAWVVSYDLSFVSWLVGSVAANGVNIGLTAAQQGFETIKTHLADDSEDSDDAGGE